MSNDKPASSQPADKTTVGLIDDLVDDNDDDEKEPEHSVTAKVKEENESLNANEIEERDDENDDEEKAIIQQQGTESQIQTTDVPEIALSNYDILVDCLPDDNDKFNERNNEDDAENSNKKDCNDGNGSIDSSNNDDEKSTSENKNDEDSTNYDGNKKQTNQAKKEEQQATISVDCDRYHLTPSTNHVGNNRLEVFLNMNRTEFEDHLAQSNEEKCSIVVDRVYDIVCNQCVPRGRFLTSKVNKLRGGFQYEILSEYICKIIIRNALEKPVASNNNDTNKSSDLQQEDEDEMEDDFELKRRRRSSLLRRSVQQDSQVKFNLGFLRDDKKKTFRIVDELDTDSDSATSSEGGDYLEELPDVISSSRQRNNNLPRRAKPKVVIKSSNLDNLDVIFNMSCTKLMQNDKFHGNNRLKVLLSLQELSYNSEKATLPHQDKIIKDIVYTVTNFWGGRFLAESTLQYTKLDDIDASKALRKVLSSRTKTSSSKPSHEGVKRPSQVKAAALEAISDGIGLGEDDDMSYLRSEAVKSLQKRKQRQGLTNKIRGLTNATANSSVGTAKGGHTNPAVPSSGSSVASTGTDISLNYALENMDIKLNKK